MPKLWGSRDITGPLASTGENGVANLHLNPKDFDVEFSSFSHNEATRGHASRNPVPKPSLCEIADCCQHLHVYTGAGSKRLSIGDTADPSRRPFSVKAFYKYPGAIAFRNTADGDFALGDLGCMPACRRLSRYKSAAASLAPRVERWSSKPEVPGSTPGCGTFVGNEKYHENENIWK